MLTLIGLAVAILQISKQDSIGAFLYKKTVRTSFNSLAKYARLAGYKDFSPSSRSSFLKDMFPEIEVLVENSQAPFGFQYGEIICFYNPRLFGIQNYDEIKIDPGGGMILPEVFGLPKEIKKPAVRLLMAKIKYLQHNFRDSPFFNGPIVKVDFFRIYKDHLSGRLKLALKFRLTNYYTFVCTNETLEESANTGFPVTQGLPDINKSPDYLQELSESRREMNDILKKHTKPTQNVFSPESILANNMVVNLNIITSDNKLLYVKRSGKVARKQSFFSSSVSGDMDPSARFREDLPEGDLDEDGAPNPFLTAVRESWEELNIKICKEHVTFLAFCRVKKLNQPFLVGEARALSSFSEILSHARLARDLYESEQLLCFDLNENPEILLSQMKESRELWGKPSALGIILSFIRRNGSAHIQSILNKISLQSF